MWWFTEQRKVISKLDNNMQNNWISNFNDKWKEYFINAKCYKQYVENI